MTSYKRDKQKRRFRFQQDREDLRYRLKTLIELAQWGLYGLLIAIILLVGIFLRLLVQ